MYKCIDNLAPAYLCNFFAPRKPNEQFSQREELTTWSVALVVVALFYGTVFLRKYVHQIP